MRPARRAHLDAVRGADEGTDSQRRVAGLRELLARTAVRGCSGVQRADAAVLATSVRRRRRVSSQRDRAVVSQRRAGDALEGRPMSARPSNTTQRKELEGTVGYLLRVDWTG